MSYWTLHKLIGRSIAVVLIVVGVLQHAVSKFSLVWALAPAVIVLVLGELLRLLYARPRPQ